MSGEVWKILIIDESPDDRAEVRRLLLEGSDRRYEFVEAKTGVAGMAHFHEVDCVVLDDYLSDMNAREVLLASRPEHQMTSAPVVVLTGTAGRNMSSGVLRAGAMDYLGKTWMNPQSLTRAVENAVERHTLQRELLEREERLQLAAESAHFGSYHQNLITGEVFWSPEMKQILGLAEDDRMPLPVQGVPDVVHPDDRQRVAEAMRASLDPRGDGIVNDEYRIVLPDSTIRWVLHRGRTFFARRDGQRRAVRSAGIVLNVTSRKNAELTVRAAEERARLLLESTGEAIYGLDTDGNCTFCNPACVRLLGFESEAALLDQNIHDLIHHTRPDGSPYPIHHCQIYQAFRNGENIHVDDEILWRADGTSFPAEYWSQPIHRDGKIVGAVVTFIDITERRREEEDRRRLAAIIESSDNAIVGMTLEGIVTSWNGGAEKLYGYTAYEMVGQPVSRLVPPDRQPEMPHILQRLRAGESIDDFETVRLGKDGSRRDVSLTLSPIKNARAEVIGASTIARDITDRKRYEQRLLEADRHKDDFIAMLAHELRNPLAPIRNATQVFELLELEDPMLIEMCGVIKRQVDQMARLLDDLLDVSRIACGKIRLKLELTDLCELARTAAEDLRGTFEEERVELIIDAPDELLQAEVDPARISQCIGNILHNALKFTDEGGSVHLELTREAQEAIIAIRDTGVGMEPEFIEHLFEPFRQADRSLHRSPGGLGLGLAMVQGVIQLHGGRVSAASEGLGKGSQFVVHLPLGPD